MDSVLSWCPTEIIDLFLSEVFTQSRTEDEVWLATLGNLRVVCRQFYHLVNPFFFHRINITFYTHCDPHPGLEAMLKILSREPDTIRYIKHLRIVARRTRMRSSSSVRHGQGQNDKRFPRLLHKLSLESTIEKLDIMVPFESGLNLRSLHPRAMAALLRIRCSPSLRSLLISHVGGLTRLMVCGIPGKDNLQSLSLICTHHSPIRENPTIEEARWGDDDPRTALNSFLREYSAHSTQTPFQGLLNLDTNTLPHFMETFFPPASQNNPLPSLQSLRVNGSSFAFPLSPNDEDHIGSLSRLVNSPSGLKSLSLHDTIYEAADESIPGMALSNYIKLGFAQATNLQTISIVTGIYSQNIEGTISTLTNMVETARSLPFFQTLSLAWIFKPYYDGESITLPRNDDWTHFVEILASLPPFRTLNVIGVLDLDFVVEESDVPPENMTEQINAYFLSSLSVISNHPNIRLDVSVHQKPTWLDIRLYRASIFDSIVLVSDDSDR